MTMIPNRLNIIKSLYIIITGLILTAISPAAGALPLSTYAENSVLADGKWAKISVPQSGIYLISNSQLRQMGFSDPSKVRIYGYGAKRLPDRLDTTFIDDLPTVQSITTSKGIIFYGVGPTSWTTTGKYGIYHPVQNPFTTEGYYFLSDRDGESREIPIVGSASASSPATEFTDRLYHEKDLVSLGQTGHFLAGEDFLYTPTRSFDFTLTDRASQEVMMESSFVAKCPSTTTVLYSANGTELPTSSSNNLAPYSSYVHYTESITRDVFSVDKDKLTIGVTYKPSSTVLAANLNYIAINYTRKLRMSGSQLSFRLSNPSARLADAGATVTVWDVTDPNGILQMNTANDQSSIVWTNDYTGQREYMAFDPSADLPSPTYAGAVANQNLHAREVPDMVIFTIPDWRAQAERIADLHANSSDSLRVLVVNQQDVFNEFASGAPDANAFRKMLKMFYDRSTDTRKLQYALFLGRGTHDNRHLTSAIKTLNYPTMPIWQTDRGDNDNESYSTDDIFAFLLDNSGTSLYYDNYCIAVGRMPVISVSDAKSNVDKLIQYTGSMPKTNWRNNLLLIADDQDGGIHMTQTEDMLDRMLATVDGRDMTYRKVYTDAYDFIGGGYPKAREDMFRILDEGVVFWTYIGHANTTSWTHENLLTYTDINNLHLKHYPIVYAATCDFLRWDGKDISAAEIMWKLDSGGAIAIISANRPVYIPENAYMSLGFGEAIFSRGSDGKRLTIGQIYQATKNNYRFSMMKDASDNKLRYVLMGDPALRPLVPSMRVIIDTINGADPESEDQTVIMAMQDVTITGHIADTDGKTAEDFNGVVSATLYDAEYSVTTKGNGSNGIEFPFDQQGSRLFAGNDSIKNGKFEMKFVMPSEISDNFRPATISLYAYSTQKNDIREAIGANRDFYVFGFDENAVPDDVEPVIESLYLNHPTFRDGDCVNTSPMVIAEISDDRGINMSTAGIGHSMTLMLDGTDEYSDVSGFFTPSADGTPSGTIAYPLENLQPGDHTLRLRVWDSAGNSASQTIGFTVRDGLTPKLYDVYTDTNPASVEANFYLSHDRPDAMIEVTISVFNLLGQPVWTSTTTGRSDMYLSYPVKWDLTDNVGRRVQRGIYIYRASIKSDGQESDTISHKLAVTAP